MEEFTKEEIIKKLGLLIETINSETEINNKILIIIDAFVLSRFTIDNRTIYFDDEYDKIIQSLTNEDTYNLMNMKYEDMLNYDLDIRNGRKNVPIPESQFNNYMKKLKHIIETNTTK